GLLFGEHSINVVAEFHEVGVALGDECKLFLAARRIQDQQGSLPAHTSTSILMSTGWSGSTGRPSVRISPIAWPSPVPTARASFTFTSAENSSRRLLAAGLDPFSTLSDSTATLAE